MLAEVYNQMAPSIGIRHPGRCRRWLDACQRSHQFGGGQLGSVNGIVFHKWISNNGLIAQNATSRFWIDNVVFKGNAAPPGPPTVSSTLPKKTHRFEHLDDHRG